MKLSEGKYFHYILIFLAAFVLYGNTVKNKFAMDDEFVIKNNKLVEQGVTGIPEIFATPYFENKQWSFGYRPLTKAMFALEYEVFGESPAVHHFINVLLYALCCLLLFGVFAKYFSEFASKTFWLLVVLLFMAHPVHTEVVASLKNREEILCLLFSLAGMWMFLKYIDTSKLISLTAGFICFTLAFLSKQTAVIFVFILPATYALKTILKKEPLKVFFRNYRLWITVFVILLLTYVFFKIPQWFMPVEKVDLLGFENPLHTDYRKLHQLYLASYSFWVYVKLAIIPHPLLYYYGLYVIPEPSAGNFLTWFGFSIAASAVYYIIFRYKKHPFLAFGAAVFITGLLPFLNIVIPINGIVAERMLFFPLFGFTVILITLMFGIDKNPLSVIKLKGKRTGMLWFIFIVLMIFYSAKTISRNGQWKNSVTLYSADMKYLDESVKANDIYATAVFDEIYREVSAGRTVKDMNAKLKDVIEKYNRTLELFPENPKAQHNLSTIYLSFFRDPRKALNHAYKARRLDPVNFKIYFNIGQAFHMLQKKDSAEFYYRLTAEKDTNFRQAWDNIIRLYSENGKTETLKPYVEEYNKLYPTSDLALAALGTLYISERDTANGIICFEKAIAMNPTVQKEKIIPIYQYYMLHKDSAKVAYYGKMLQ